MAAVNFLVAAPATVAPPLVAASSMAAGAPPAPARASSTACTKPDGGCSARPLPDQGPSLGRAGRATFKDISSLQGGSSAPNTSIVEAPAVSI
jgi:hypothetical protein